MLPKTFGLVVFFGALSLVPVAAGALMAAGVIAALGDGEFQLAILWAVGAVVLVSIGLYFLQFLVGRCQLSLSHERLEYDEFLLGVRRRRRCREVPVTDVIGLQVGDAERGGIQIRTRQGEAFFLRLPLGNGAFSTGDILWLKRQWLGDLALERNPDGPRF